MLDKKAINLSLDMPEIYPTTFKKLSQKLFNARGNSGWIVSQEVKTIHF